MSDPPCVEFHDHEYVDHGEERGVLRHEVAGEDLMAVILEKCFPGLPIAWGSIVFTMYFRIVLVECLMPNLRSSSSKILSSPQLGFSALMRRMKSMCSRGIVGRPISLVLDVPAPVESEALAVPSNHGLGSDEDERCLPIVAKFRDPDPERAIGCSEPRAPLHSLVDSELLSQGEVLEDERTLAFEEGSETSGCQGENGCHWGTVAAGEKANDFSRYRVFADYGGCKTCCTSRRARVAMLG